MFYAAYGGTEAILEKLLTFDLNLKEFDLMHRNVIHYAVLGKNNFALQTFWLQGVKYEEYDVNGMNPLMYAAKSDSFDNFSLLIDNGCNTEVMIENCKLITLCAEGGNPESIAKMLELGQSIEESSPYGTPIQIAAKNNRTEAVKFLIKNGANIFIKDDQFNTILHYAAFYSNSELIQFEIEAGLKVNDMNIAKQTPLSFALKECNPDAIVCLLKAGAQADVIGDSVITVATQKKKYELIKRAKELGLNVSSRDSNGFSALHWAVQLKDTDLIDLLINQGIDIDIPDSQGMTPLIQAIRDHHMTIIMFLIEKGANLNKQDIYGSTPLHEAVIASNFEVVELLLKKGANPNIINKELKTPLVLASTNGDYNIMKLLLDNKADPNIPGKNGMTALYYVKTNPSLVKLLNSYGCVNPIIQKYK